MHHTLPFYGWHQHRFLRLYMFLIKLTRLPLVGRLGRWLANSYGRSKHGGYLITLEEAEKIIDASNSVSLGPCACRQAFHNCNLPIMTEIVVSAGREVYSKKNNKEFNQISKAEAKGVLRHYHRSNVIHTIMHCQGLFYAICTCCSCCCVPYRLKRDYNIEYALVRNKNIVADYLKQLSEEEV